MIPEVDSRPARPKMPRSVNLVIKNRIHRRNRPLPALLILLLAGCATGPAPDPEPATDTIPSQPGRVDAWLAAHYRSVPLIPRHDRTRYYVDITLEGKRGRMLVDTGAQNSVLFDGAVAKFGITPTDRLGDTFGGVAGDIRTRWATFDSFLIGDKISVPPGDIRIVRHAGEQDADGLLGFDILSRLHAVIDLKSNRLWFLDPSDRNAGALASVAAGASMKSAKLRRMLGHDFLKIRLSGRTYQAILDTGAPTWLVPEDVAGELKLPLTRMEHDARGVGEGTVEQYLARTPGRAVIDDFLTLPRCFTPVADHGGDIPIDNYGGLFGCSILADNDALIDLGNDRIYFEHQRLRTRFAAPADPE